MATSPMKRWFLGAAVALTLISVIVSAVSLFWYKQAVEQPLGLSPDSYFEIERGDTPQGVLKQIIQQHSADIHPLAGRIWLKFSFSGQAIQKGLYKLDQSMSLIDVYNMLNQGRQHQFAVTLIEGQTWREWLAVLRNAEFIVDDWSQDVAAEMLNLTGFQKASEQQNWEGLLLADTYAYTARTPISEIVLRAHSALVQALEVQVSIVNLPLELTSKYDALILASIVEKETAVPEERPLIAGVFLNRLGLNMRLQTDPTIIYGLGEAFDGDIKRVHMRQRTPYNTYVINGLPPTPIAMVGKEAISAVFNASITEYIYFVAKGDGTHQFSVTLSEHNRAVQQYQLGK